MSVSASKIDLGIGVFLGLVAGFIFYPFAAIGVDPHHDGIMLKPALDVLSGQVLFRDTFTQYGPLTTYLQALALMVAPTLLSLRILTVLAYAGSLIFFYLSWRTLLPRSLALVASLLFVSYPQFYDPHWPLLPWSSVLAMFFQSIALWTLLRMVDRSSHPAWSWTLGLACAGTLWCRQPVGLTLLTSVAAVGLGLHLAGWRNAGSSMRLVWIRVAAGFGVVTALILGHLLFHGALWAWWEQNVLWPRRWALSYNDEIFWKNARGFLLRTSVLHLVAALSIAFAPTLVRRFVPRFPHWVDLVWLSLAMVLYALWGFKILQPSMMFFLGGWSGLILTSILIQAGLVIVQAVRIRPAIHRREYYLLASFSGLALASTAQIYPLPSANYLFWALAPGFGLFVYFAHRLLKMPPLIFSIVLVLLFTPAAYDKYLWSRHNLAQSSYVLARPHSLSGMRVAPALGAAFERSFDRIAPILARNPLQPVILYGDDALYLTWFGYRHNPSAYYVNWQTLLSSGEQAKRWDFLFREKPIVLLNGRGAGELKFVPVEYELAHYEPELNLRIMLPQHLD